MGGLAIDKSNIDRPGKPKERRPHPIFISALLTTSSEIVETTICRRRLLFADYLKRTGEEPLPKRVMCGEMVGGNNWLLVWTGEGSDGVPREDIEKRGIKSEG